MPISPYVLAVAEDGSVLAHGIASAGAPEYRVVRLDARTGETLATYDTADAGGVDAEGVVGGAVALGGPVDGQVWVSSPQGLDRFAFDGAFVERVTPPDGLRFGPHSPGLVADSGGRIYGRGFGPGSQGDGAMGFIVFDPPTGQFSFFEDDGCFDDLLSHNMIMTHDDTLATVTRSCEDGASIVLATIRTDGTGYSELPLGELHDPYGTFDPFSVAQDADGSLYTVGRWDGAVHRIEDDGELTEVISPSDYGVPIDEVGNVLGLYVDSAAGRIYVGSPAHWTSGNAGLVSVFQRLASPDVQWSAPVSANTCQEVSVGPERVTGTPDVTWYQLTSGVLPAGLTLDPRTGVISGAATQTGTFEVGVTAYNGVSPATATTTSDTVTVTITVTQAQFETTGVALVGVPEVGQSLSADIGAWDPAPQVGAYQWLRDDEPIEGATGVQHMLTAEDLDHAVSVRVTGTTGCLAPATVTADSVMVTSPPVEPSDPPVEPSDPPVEPSDPPVEPSDPPVEPSDPPVEPSDPPVEPSDPPVEPSDPPVEPSDPPVEPSDPPVEPSDPPVEPSDPPVEPSDPPVEPSTATAPVVSSLPLTGAHTAAVGGAALALLLVGSGVIAATRVQRRHR
ncbi:putative Ig domain-containing protein [Xylanimonas ulmi]|nr:putative Ig domain-containing protein [Xylanibacterium ulmi]